MQISDKAAKTYEKLGVVFSHNFKNFGTQTILVKGLKSSMEVGILGKNFPKKKVGTYFVYNKGDKIDFNHPNKEGHYLLASEISKQKYCLK